MAIFVLVHGSWHGGWCYARVAKLLREAGHDVYTPTLTGMGERSHLAGIEINLDTHVQDIVNVVTYEDLNEVILCGHSFGGVVITGVAAKIPERLKSLFYLDAFVPDDGQSYFDLVSTDIISMILGAAKTAGGKSPPIPAAAFNVNERDRAWVDKLCVPQTLAAFAQSVSLGVNSVAARRRTYVYATANGMNTFDATYERFKADPNWTVHTVHCGHDVMLDEPEELARLLMNEAKS